MRSPRLLVDERAVSSFPAGVSPEVLTLFRPGVTLHPGVFRCGGRVLLDRMDAMGIDADQAMACLTDALELASDAYGGLGHPGDIDPDLGLGATSISGLDATDWLLRLSFDTDPRAINWLLSLVEECDPAMVLRLCLMAKPAATVSLEVPDSDQPAPTSGTRLVVTQTRADAEALRRCLGHELPHLSDLIRCTHLGGDESAPQLLEQLRGLAQLRIPQQVTFVFRAPVRAGELPENFRVVVTDEPDSAPLLGMLLHTMGVRPAWHVG